MFRSLSFEPRRGLARLSWETLAVCSLTMALGQASPAPGAPGVIGGYLHQHYTVADGLPTNMVTSAVSTTDGLMWFGTQDGLVRFDGTHFEVFNTGNVSAFNNNRISSLVATPGGELWILTARHSLVVHRDGVFTRFSQSPGLRKTRIRALDQDRGGIHVVTDEGLYGGGGGAFEKLVGGRWQDQLISSFSASDGALWLGFWHAGIVRVDGASVSSWPNLAGQPLGVVQRFLEYSDGTVWGETEELGYCIFTQGRWTGRCIPKVQEDPCFEQRLLLSPNHGESAWYLNAGERVGYDPSGELRRIPADDGGPKGQTLSWDRGGVYFTAPTQTAGAAAMGLESLSIGSIVATALDVEGGVWLATVNGGLHYFRPARMTTYGTEHGLPDAVHYSVAEANDGRVLIGGVTTISRFDGKTFEPLLKHRSWWANLHTDRRGETWFAGSQDQPHRIGGDGFARLDSSQLPERVTSVWLDRTGTRWFAGLEELKALRDGAWRRFHAEDGLPFTPQDLFESRDGALWIKNVDSGLARFEHGRFSRFDTSHGLPSNQVRYIYEDEAGILWLAVYGFGLVRVDLTAIESWQEDSFHRAELTHFNQQDGLFDNAISSILEDDHGRLWMSSNRGIFWVFKSELEEFAAGRERKFHVAHYGVADGMRDRETNGAFQSGALKASDGQFWYPTMEGVVTIDPDEVDRQPPPAVIFDGLFSEGLQLPAGELEAKHRSFEVQVAVPAFSAPRQLTFRYQLVGHDEAWRQTDRRRLVFTEVPGGSYTLRVQARHRSGLWSEEASELPIEIQPYLSETGWFRALLLATVVLLLVGVERLRHQRLIRRERELEALVHQRTSDLMAEKEKVAEQAEQLGKLDRAKSRFFANISHEFRTPLTLLIGPLEDQLAGRHGELPGALRPIQETMLSNSRRLLCLVEQMLDLARFEAGEQKLNLAPGDLGQLVLQMTGSMAALAERQGVKLACSAADLPAQFDADKLGKVLGNLIANAVKFTHPGGRVDVTMRREGSEIEIAVDDDGVGIAAGDLPRIFDRYFHVDNGRPVLQPSTGLGLSLAREFTRLHGGHLRVESELGQGSTFRIFLPWELLALPGSGRGQVTDEVTREAISNAQAPVPPPATDVGQGSESLDDEDRPAVLVVEDNAEVRAYVSSILKANFRIFEAEDGQEGLLAARRCRPDLIVSDVMMPRLDGHGLALALKKDPMTEGIPVILLTARAATQDKIEGFSTGVDSYLTKPFDGALLETVVRNLITQRRRLRELFRNPSRAEARSEQSRRELRPDLEQRAREVIASRLVDDDFGVEQLASQLHLSRSQLFRRLRAEASTTPTQLIRVVRLENAAEMLSQRVGTVSEVAYAVGFKSLSHFTRCFRAHYAVLPSTYLKAPIHE